MSPAARLVVLLPTSQPSLYALALLQCLRNLIVDCVDERMVAAALGAAGAGGKPAPLLSVISAVEGSLAARYQDAWESCLPGGPGAEHISCAACALCMGPEAGTALHVVSWHPHCMLHIALAHCTPAGDSLLKINIPNTAPPCGCRLCGRNMLRPHLLMHPLVY